MATRFEQIKNNIQKKTNEQKEATRREYKEFFDHPLLFVALAASGLLSALAGLAIGLGLRMENGILIANIDVAHAFFALLYSILFPYFFEFGLANWLHKNLHREPGNMVQQWTSIAMIGVTFIGTAATAYSAMDVLVTAGGFFDSFKEIPASVQRWIAFSLPTMFLLNIAAGELYRQFTTEAVLKRSADIELREARIAVDMEIALAKMDADKNISIAAAEEYSRRAAVEAPEIGKRKGNENWQKDRPQNQPAPAMGFNRNEAEVELTLLREENARLKSKVEPEQYPTQGGSK